MDFDISTANNVNDEPLILCHNGCGRGIQVSNWSNYFCYVCEVVIPFCEGCYGKQNYKATHELGIKHDREEHSPFSIDIV